MTHSVRHCAELSLPSVSFGLERIILLSAYRVHTPVVALSQYYAPGKVQVTPSGNAP